LARVYFSLFLSLSLSLFLYSLFLYSSFLVCHFLWGCGVVGLGDNGSTEEAVSARGRVSDDVGVGNKGEEAAEGGAEREEEEKEEVLEARKLTS
jgi:hypothetical protein